MIPTKTQSDFTSYQEAASKTRMPITLIDNPQLIYNLFGLVNEAGELAGKFKKIMRDKDGQISPEDREAIKGELGDVLWYLSQVSLDLEIDLEDIALGNILKLASRQTRGTLQGDGDNR